MKTIPIKVWNRIEMLRQPIAAIARASASNRKRWVTINVNKFSVAVRPPHLYCIIDTEFDATLLERYAEYGDEDLAIVNQTQYYSADITALYALLLSLQVDLESFDAPRHVGHPLL